MPIRKRLHVADGERASDHEQVQRAVYGGHARSPEFICADEPVRCQQHQAAMDDARRRDTSRLEQPHRPVPDGAQHDSLSLAVCRCCVLNRLTGFMLTQAQLGLPASGGSNSVDIFASALADGGAAVVFFNRATTTANATLALSELQQLPGWTIPEGQASAHDVWSGKKLEFQLVSDDGMVSMVTLPSGELEAHGSSFIRLTKTTK